MLNEAIMPVEFFETVSIGFSEMNTHTYTHTYTHKSKKRTAKQTQKYHVYFTQATPSTTLAEEKIDFGSETNSLAGSQTHLK